MEETVLNSNENESTIVETQKTFKGREIQKKYLDITYAFFIIFSFALFLYAFTTQDNYHASFWISINTIYLIFGLMTAYMKIEKYKETKCRMVFVKLVLICVLTLIGLLWVIYDSMHLEDMGFDNSVYFGFLVAMNFIGMVISSSLFLSFLVSTAKSILNKDVK